MRETPRHRRAALSEIQRTGRQRELGRRWRQRIQRERTAAEIPPTSLAQRSVSSSVQVPLIWAPVSGTESSGVVGAATLPPLPTPWWRMCR